MSSNRQGDLKKQPAVSDFSTGNPQQINTIKKDYIYSEEIEF